MRIAKIVLSCVMVASGLNLVACGQMSMSHVKSREDILRDEYSRAIDNAKTELQRCKDDVAARTKILRSLEVAAVALGLDPLIAVAEVLNEIREVVGNDHCNDMYNDAKRVIEDARRDGERHKNEVEAFA